MGKCISKISKDHLLDLEEYLKNKTSFEKRKRRPGLDIIAGGGIYEDPFHKEVFKNVGSITNWGTVEKLFFKNGLTPKDILC